MYALISITVMSITDLPRQLECWHCSSETSGAEDFCGVTFDEDSVPSSEMMKEHNFNVLRNCSSTTHSEHERPVCRKTVEEINGKVVTKRFCYYTNKSDSLDRCMEDPPRNNVVRISVKIVKPIDAIALTIMWQHGLVNFYHFSWPNMYAFRCRW
ncbi:unnamed protein product [Ceratitis capitata]|uniref:(Mediterranean fruit fly) hypothetical protein n=1 Tax=Ceratitis capitata TaxID=7213 RepID=A0A811UJU3_CERCA|nr:unnamed protein product [Ceratitis capitata]